MRYIHCTQDYSGAEAQEFVKYKNPEDCGRENILTGIIIRWNSF